MTRSASLAVLELGPAMARCLDGGMVGVVGVVGERKSRGEGNAAAGGKRNQGVAQARSDGRLSRLTVFGLIPAARFLSFLPTLSLSLFNYPPPWLCPDCSTLGDATAASSMTGLLQWPLSDRPPDIRFVCPRGALFGQCDKATAPAPQEISTAL